MTACDRMCHSQCDDCHDLDNCVPAEVTYGDLTLCRDCRKKYPVEQPWRIGPETGGIIEREK